MPKSTHHDKIKNVQLKCNKNEREMHYERIKNVINEKAFITCKDELQAAQQKGRPTRPSYYGLGSLR